MAILVEPLIPVVARILWWTLDERPDAAGRFIESVVPELIRIHVVVVHAPHHIAAVSRQIEILRLGREDEGIHREMRLEKPPMSHRFDGG